MLVEKSKINIVDATNLLLYKVIINKKILFDFKYFFMISKH